VSNVLKSIFSLKAKMFSNTFLLLYTVACVCFYDPIVSVDDTPRTPIFNEIIGTSSGTISLTTRYKLKEFEPKLFSALTTFNLNRFLLKSSHVALYLFCYFWLLVYFRNILNSIPIRAPSL